MHSAVFAPGPALAGDIAAAFLAGGCNPADLVDAEVMDREEDGHSPRLYGALRVPAVSLWTPHPKAGAAGGAMLDGALSRIAEVIRDDRLTLVGPGATMQAVKQRLGVDGTLLGVDVFHNGQLVDTDVSAARILTLLEAGQGRIVMSIVGGQGFLFGRGNQQFSPAVIRRVGVRNIVVVAALEKLTALGGQPLYVDTGDDALDQELAGFINVRIGARRSLQYRIAVPTALDADTLQLSAGAARG
jgi:predicted polyphosphate/ATP-dependent NAD kinase